MRIALCSMSCRVAICLLLPLLPISAAPQNPSQLPKIRVSARLVQLGIIVRDKNRTVANLTKDDFTVFDRGKPQPISIFSADAAAATQQPPQQPLPQNVFSDVPHYGITAPRSITIVLLDNLNTLYGSSPESQYESTPFWIEDHALQNAKSHLIEFIKQLPPQDRIAIYGLHHSLYVLCDFTSDRDQLLNILKNYDAKSITNREIVEPGRTAINLSGHDSTAENFFRQGSGFDNSASMRLAAGANEERGAETMAALQQIASHVANIPGRKNLVWLTANLPFSGAAMAHVLGPANIAVYPVDARGLLPAGFSEQAEIGGNADADEVSGAAGHYDNMPGQSQRPIGIATMEKVAEDTGGKAFVNTNDLTGAIRKAVDDSAVTYTLGFYIDPSALDGKFHNIKVEVKGHGLTVRYPRGYFAFPDTEATKNEDQVRLVTAVRSPIESSSIPLTARIDRTDQPPNSLKILCSIDAHDLHLAQSGGERKGTVEVYIIEQDQTGKVIFQSGKTFTLQFPEQRYPALLKSGILFHEYVQTQAGATTMRILVEDPATSDVGTVIVPMSDVK
ncbi:MAG TPA: VWA domain-containing protein [Candidatus Acidoferrales bacterium]|nr:VWA domain-containing protein [Candidatus Acidoferrales bacterium]